MLASISVAGIFLGAFIWSVKDKQYEDEAAPPVRILFDDAPTSNNSETIQSPTTSVRPGN